MMWHKPHLLKCHRRPALPGRAARCWCAAVVWVARVPSLSAQASGGGCRVAAHAQAQRDSRKRCPSLLRGNFFSLESGGGCGRRSRKLPWVRKVEVRRSGRRASKSSIEEHRPAAHWGEGPGELVNSFGEVFAAALVDRERACLRSPASGRRARAEVLKRYSELVEMFKAVGRCGRCR
jgi:cell division protein FtsQ